MKDPPLNDFPLQIRNLGPVFERPTLLVVWEGPITQDIAAVLIKSQQKSAREVKIFHERKASLVVSRFVVGKNGSS
jgi:hypothetical protein